MNMANNMSDKECNECMVLTADLLIAMSFDPNIMDACIANQDVCDVITNIKNFLAKIDEN